MTQNGDFFKPESVDEQVDQLSLNVPNQQWIGQEHVGKPAQIKARQVRERQAAYQVEQQQDAPVRPVRETQAEHQQDAPTHLVRELQAYYQVEHQQNLDSLEHARQRIATHESASHSD